MTGQAPVARGRGRGRGAALPLSPTQVEAVWDLGRWADCRRTSRGSSNLSYFLSTERGHFVLRLSNDRKTEAGIDQEVAFLEHLAGRGLPVPEVVPTRAGAAWSRIDGGICMVTRRLPGDHGDPHDAFHARRSGEVLARYHHESRNLPSAAQPLFGSDLPNLGATGERLAAVLGAAGPVMGAGDRQRLGAAVATVTAAWEAASSELAGLGPWPRVVSHGSLGSTAVLFEDGALTALLDVERAADEARALDLAYTVRGYSRAREDGSLNLERVSAVTDGYREVEPVTEAASMPLAMRVQRLLKVRRKASNFMAQHELGRTEAKDALKFTEMLEDEVGRITWLEENNGPLAEAFAA